uniref:Uncharacterized protein n=1 Tax=Nelumbo nucifera TaxID=4432 RepID=A0A822ZE39_NELNU|nr:TPA_asm: hypothetical protein HUJ06_016042 [Nelumbo nucifera]
MERSNNLPLFQESEVSPFAFQQLELQNSRYSVSYLEMVALKSTNYTSLKDLLPPSPAAGIYSPNFTGNQSWHEIPIKNRLVKHAAWAYLQPNSTSPKPEAGGFLRQLMVRCNGCFRFFSEHIVAGIKRALGLASEEDEVQPFYPETEH